MSDRLQLLSGYEAAVVNVLRREPWLWMPLGKVAHDAQAALVLTDEDAGRFDDEFHKTSRLTSITWMIKVIAYNVIITLSALKRVEEESGYCSK